MFCWQCIYIYLCNKNQLDRLFILRLFRQSTFTCFGHMCSPSPVRILCTRGGADKSLARPGKKQATATKPRIYSTCSPRCSIHLLARCSNFGKPLKKIQKVVRTTRATRQQWLPRRKKNGDFSIVFSVQGTSGSPTGPDPGNRVGNHDIGSPGRSVSSGLRVPCEPGHCRARTRHPLWTSRGVFPSKCPSIAPAEMSNTPRW